MAQTWDPTLSVGHPVLDAQHRSILKAVEGFLGRFDGISGQNRGEFHERFNDLVDVLLHHFETEEEILARCQYPQLAQHRELHRTMIEFLSEILLETTKGFIDTASAVQRVRDWLGTHLAEDMHYRPYVAAGN